MKKLVLSLSLVLAFSSATAAFAAIPQNIRIGTDRPMRHLNQKFTRRTGWLRYRSGKGIMQTHQYAMYVCRKSAGCVNPVLKSEED